MPSMAKVNFCEPQETGIVQLLCSIVGCGNTLENHFYMASEISLLTVKKIYRTNQLNHAFIFLEVFNLKTPKLFY